MYVCTNEQSDWIDFFNHNKQLISSLIDQENTINKEIDYLVADCFNLTQEEINHIDEYLDNFI